MSSFLCLEDLSRDCRYPLTEDKAFIIGSDEYSDLTIPHTSIVSGVHCTLLQRKGMTRCFIYDQSKSGTFVNDREIGKGNFEEVKVGDVVQIGKRQRIECAEVDSPVYIARFQLAFFPPKSIRLNPVLAHLMEQQKLPSTSQAKPVPLIPRNPQDIDNAKKPTYGNNRIVIPSDCPSSSKRPRVSKSPPVPLLKLNSLAESRPRDVERDRLQLLETRFDELLKTTSEESSKLKDQLTTADLKVDQVEKNYESLKLEMSEMRERFDRNSEILLQNARRKADVHLAKAQEQLSICLSEICSLKCSLKAATTRIDEMSRMNDKVTERNQKMAEKKFRKLYAKAAHWGQAFLNEAIHCLRQYHQFTPRGQDSPRGHQKECGASEDTSETDDDVLALNETTNKRTVTKLNEKDDEDMPCSLQCLDNLRTNR